MISPACNYVAVGTSVTHRPPHRSRRAVFPHRAPQRYSLPQSAKREFKLLLTSVNLRNSWTLNLVAVQHRPKMFAVITLLLTSAIQPFPENLHRMAKEFVQALIVPYDTVVVVITT